MGVVSRRWVWVKSIGVACGCGCNEVYRFPHYLLLSFLQQYTYFFSSFFLVFRSLYIYNYVFL